mmetsp:Transcript_60645/g.112488  ORF Transcript_60645/g.112488 Transcript_60645/m.112488 type:complete len:342 (-) Transcript_60645:84-1109(-)
MRPWILHLHERPLTLVRFNHDGDFFITCAKDGEVNLVRTENCERVGTYSPHGDKPGAVYAVDVTMDCTYVVTASADGKIVFYAFTGEVVRSVNHGGIVKFVEWNQKPGEQNKVVTCNDKLKSGSELSPNRIMVWEFDRQRNGECHRLLSIDDALPMKATKVKWGPHDETLISIHEEGTFCIFDSSSGERLHLVQAHEKAVTSLNFSSDRMLMITSSKDQSAKLWTMDDYECVKTYRTDRPLNDAAISPIFAAEEDPKLHVLLGGGQDAKDVTTTAGSSGKFEALLWHMVFEEELGQIKGGFGPLNTLAWFPDGQGYVTGGEDGYVRVHTFDTDYFTSKKFE